jgi:opacity protein-like surface antigen
MKRLLCGLAMVADLIGAAQAEDATPPSDQDSNVVPMPPATWLFVQVGDSYTSDGKTLPISGIAPQTLMFTDRPERLLARTLWRAPLPAVLGKLI